MHKIPSKPPGAARFIAAADLHLGRRVPTPEIFRQPQFSPEGAWRSIVDLVVNEEMEVDGLLLAGDLFDHEEDLLEAPYFFEKGLREISKKEKPVIAIAGNHDFRALKRIHQRTSLSHFHLLGVGGKWETSTLTFREQKICFEGWSFPRNIVQENPLTTLPPRQEGVVTIGLLHGECDGSKESHYAPFSLRELVASRRDAWILGHIHIPKQLHADPLVIYCGSAQGLDSSETGERGIWIIDVKSSGQIESHFVPFAGLLWKEISVVIDEKEEVEILLQRALEKELNPWEALRVIGLKVHFEGVAQHFQEMKERCKNAERLFFSLQKEKTFFDCFVQSYECAFKPVIDLALLSLENSILGLLAKKLLILESQDNPQKKLMLREARNAIEEKRRQYHHFQEEVSEATIEKELLARGYEILDELLSQRGTNATT